MKYYIAIIFILISQKLFSQQETVVVNETRSVYEGKSYLVMESLRLVPGPHGTGFSVSAATDGEFHAKAYDKKANYNGSKGENYVRTETILKEGITDEYELGRVEIGEKNVHFQYVDGLGRIQQNIGLEASPSRKDIVQFYEYDNFGRQSKTYLPFTYTSNNGMSLGSSNEKADAFYGNTYAVDDDDRHFAEHVFDNSPLNQVLHTYGPGGDWFVNGKKVSEELVVNRSNQVRYWQLKNGSPISYTFYPANSLIGIQKIDEDGRIAIEYKDFRGQVVLKRVKSGTSSWNDTYFIYDDLGNLRFVLSPEAVDFTPTAVVGDIDYVQTSKSITTSNFSGNSIVYGPDAYVKLIADFAFKATSSSTFSVTSGAPPAQSIEDFAFAYEYDKKRRLIKKKIPGADWIYFVYDQWDRQVLFQDGNLRSKSGGPYWKYTKYDEFNRPIVEGIATLSSINVGDEYSGSYHHEIGTNNVVGYTLSRTFPSAGVSTVNSVTYYDNYNFLTYTNWNSNGTNFGYVNEVNIEATYLALVKGQITGTKVKNLGNETWLAAVNYYDKKYREIQIIAENHLGGFDRISNEYDFVGKLLKTKRVHQTNITSLTTLESFEYDHNGRVLRKYHSIDGASPVLVAENGYNELGELIEKNHYAPNGGMLQSTDFRYNIRGWLTSINNSQLTSDGGVTNDDNNDLFGMNMTYNSSVSVNGAATEARYNGNISAISWKTSNLVDEPQEKVYGFSYDMLERLKSASYAIKTAGTWSGQGGGFDETVSGYDKNGNILQLNRYAWNNGSRTEIDELAYTYQGNQLLNVKDYSNNIFGFKDLPGSPTGMTEYGYDKNGNMYYDLNKGIVDIQYNHLNLPTIVELDGNRFINYSYDASGAKLSSTATDNGTQINKTDYVGGVHYTNGELAFATMPEGRLVKTASGWDYEYFLADHLGNTRVTYGYTNEINTYTATMETEKSTEEEAEFIKLNSRTGFYNHTPPTLEFQNPDESLVLRSVSGGTSQKMGAGKYLKVSAGDKIDLQAFAYYEAGEGDPSQIFPGIVSAVSGAFGAVGGTEGATIQSSFDSNLPGVMSNVSNGAGEPRAYLIYILFDENYAPSPQFGYDPVTLTATTRWEELTIPEYTIPHNGHLFIYVANESDVNVYFDDVKIVHKKNNNTLQVTQTHDYYPFGLTYNAFQREVEHKNKYQFQGQELQTDFDLGWSQFKWRNSDPAIGRFFNVDPLAEKFYYNSTYAFSENRLVDGVELEGLERVSTHQLSDEDLTNAVAAEFMMKKHSLYSLFTRPFGYEAVFVQNEHGNFQTGLGETSDGFWLGSLKYGLDILNVLSFGKGGGTTGFLAKTPGKTALTNLAREGLENASVKSMIPTERGLQNTETINQMANKLRETKTTEEFIELFKNADTPIEVIEHEGRYYIHNGHHRVEAIIEAGVEYEIPVTVIPLEESRFDSIEELLEAADNEF